MNTLSCIRERRSIRSFLNRGIDDKIIRKLLESAMYAPSANNRQPWHFIIADNKQILEEIPRIHKYAQMADKAPLGVLVCGDLELEPVEGYLAVNCAAATQNILLAAHDSSLGAVWIGVFPREKRITAFKKLFELPESILPISYIVIGYPEAGIKVPERYKPERIHRNRW